MIIGLRKENFDYLKRQVYHGKVRQDKLFVFLRLKPGKYEYRERDGRNYKDATFEPSEIKEIMTLSNGVTLLEINRHSWKKDPESYSFPEDLEGYVPFNEAVKNLTPSDEMLLKGIGML